MKYKLCIVLAVIVGCNQSASEMPATSVPIPQASQKLQSAGRFVTYDAAGVQVGDAMLGGTIWDAENQVSLLYDSAGSLQGRLEGYYDSLDCSGQGYISQPVIFRYQRVYADQRGDYFIPTTEAVSFLARSMWSGGVCSNIAGKIGELSLYKLTAYAPGKNVPLRVALPLSIKWQISE